MDWFVDHAYRVSKEVVEHRERAKDKSRPYDNRLFSYRMSLHAENRLIKCAESVMRRLETFGCLGNIFD